MKKKIIATTILVLVLLVLILLHMLWPKDKDDGLSDHMAQSINAQTTTELNKNIEPKTSSMTFVTGLEEMPKSLNGTEVDGVFLVDANGHLKITNSIRHIFDYFLAAVGEESVETISARIKAYIHHQLKEPAAGEAEHILNGYIAYKMALTNLQKQDTNRPTDSNDLSTLQRQMDQAKSIRSQYLSPEVIQAFFGDEDAYNRYEIAHQQINQNKNLNSIQRAQQLAEIQSQLPASMRDSIKTANTIQDLQSLTAEWKNHGGSTAELRNIREKLVGADGADRLEQLDKDNAAWDQRMNSWLAQRDTILNSSNLTTQDKQSQIAGLRSNLFNSTEQIRVNVLEKMHDGKIQ